MWTIVKGRNIVGTYWSVQYNGALVRFQMDNREVSRFVSERDARRAAFLGVLDV